MLPKRTANTMSNAIALSSPSGHMSKRGKDAALKRLSIDLFGPGGLSAPKLPQQPSKRENLLRQAKDLRDLAARGMKTRSFNKEADRLEALAAES